MIKIKSTADIIGGSVFFADDNGFDPEYLDNGDLLPNGMYIRLEGSDGSVAYVSAYELDKALGIIGEMSMGKADASDIAALREELSEKASLMEFEILKSDVSNKASKLEINELLDFLDTKADNTTVDDIIVRLATKADAETVNALQETVATKADASELNKLKSDVATLESVVGSMSDSSSIEIINEQIRVLTERISKLATETDVNSIKNGVNIISAGLLEVNDEIENIKTNVNSKASKVYVQGQVSELNKAITGLSAKTDSKADKIDVSLKANKSDLNAAVNVLTRLNTTVGELETTVADNYQSFNDKLNTKVKASDFNSAISQINTSLNSKIDRDYFDESIHSVNTQLEEFGEEQEAVFDDLQSTLNSFEATVNNTITQLRSTLNSQSNQILKQTNQITSLTKTTQEHEESLKNEWVRVMTPEDYNRLSPVGSNHYNSKKPNTVYMLVRYNKPYAVYIGDVLIAQAEQKEPQGFVYNFPIMF